MGIKAFKDTPHKTFTAEIVYIHASLVGQMFDLLKAGSRFEFEIAMWMQGEWLGAGC